MLLSKRASKQESKRERQRASKLVNDGRRVIEPIEIKVIKAPFFLLPFLPLHLSPFSSSSFSWPPSLPLPDLRTSDSGLYTCHASSETGETKWSAALIVEQPTNPSIVFHRTPEPSTFPGPPTKPTILNITTTSVAMTWKENPKIGQIPGQKTSIAMDCPEWLKYMNQI